jgi:uncharacterized protein YggE
MKKFLFLLTLSSLLHAKEHVQSVSVIGKCQKEMEPDKVAITYTIEFLDMDQQISSDKANKQLANLKNKIAGLKLKELELATTNYTIQPLRQWENQKQIFKGHQTQIGLKVITSQTTRVGELFKISSDLKIENLSGPHFFIGKEKYQKGYQECLKIASADATTKANTLAKNLNIQLGKVIKVSETQTHQSPYPRPEMPMNLKMGRSEMMAEAPQIDIGKQDINMDLYVEFEIK